MITARIIGATGKQLKVNGEGEITVAVHQHPPIDEDVYALPFRSYFTDDGTPLGTNTMNVNGLGIGASVDYYIKAVPDYDIYIKYITVEIGDGGSPNLNKFGSLSALANGVSFYWDTQADPEYILNEGIKTNKNFIRSFGTYGFGDGTSSFLADVSGGSAEKSYLPTLDIEQRYGLKWGLRLRKGTNDKIILRVNDDLTALTTFNAIGTGTRI
jgi:hypothetical protein